MQCTALMSMHRYHPKPFPLPSKGSGASGTVSKPRYTSRINCIGCGIFAVHGMMHFIYNAHLHPFVSYRNTEKSNIPKPVVDQVTID